VSGVRSRGKLEAGKSKRSEVGGRRPGKAGSRVSVVRGQEGHGVGGLKSEVRENQDLGSLTSDF